MDRDSVTLRENPCSSKNIRIIRSIRTEQKNEHGNTRNYTDTDEQRFRDTPWKSVFEQKIRIIRSIRTEQKNEHGNTRNYTEADEQRFRDTLCSSKNIRIIRSIRTGQ